jgi:hypothetical protein
VHRFFGVGDVGHGAHTRVDVRPAGDAYAARRTRDAVEGRTTNPPVAVTIGASPSEEYRP